MAIALYLITGARGSELKCIHLQSLGYERVPDADAAVTFDMIKLTAYETKTKLAHLNLLLAHAHPWRCGAALLGLSVLVRTATRGAPPFAMATDADNRLLRKCPTCRVEFKWGRVRPNFALREAIEWVKALPPGVRKSIME